MQQYYSDKIDILRDIFGVSEIRLANSGIYCGENFYPIIDDVIILLDKNQWPNSIRNDIHEFSNSKITDGQLFSQQVQDSFSMQWRDFNDILPEHEKEFHLYFDQIDLDNLKNKRCADIGCGIGRWSKFLAPYTDQLILLDFSESIFVARNNLRDFTHTIYFMGDLTAMPFRNDFADLVFSLGVLHHLHQDCLELTRQLNKFAPEILVYLYYDLDNRPNYYRVPLYVMKITRLVLCRVQNRKIRNFISYLLVFFAYLPFITVGKIAALFNQGHRIPLYEFYQDRSFHRIRQDAYDRFFTPLEQRVSRKQINELCDTYREISISQNLPYWHFVCRK